VTLYDWEIVCGALVKYGAEGPMVDVGGIKHPELGAYDPPRLMRVPGQSLYGWAVEDYEVVNPADDRGMSGEALATLRPRSYRTVVCTGVLEHADAPHALAWALVGMLLPGGLLAVTTPWEWQTHGDPGGDHWRFSPSGLAHLFAPTDLVTLDTGIQRCGGKSIAWLIGSRGPLGPGRPTPDAFPTPREKQ